jgi:hypothetical protein
MRVVATFAGMAVGGTMMSPRKTVGTVDLGNTSCGIAINVLGKRVVKNHGLEHNMFYRWNCTTKISEVYGRDLTGDYIETRDHDEVLPTGGQRRYWDAGFADVLRAHINNGLTIPVIKNDMRFSVAKERQPRWVLGN